MVFFFNLIKHWYYLKIDNMNKSIFFSVVIILFLMWTDTVTAQTKYKVVTTVESIVPMGVGRSRIVEADTNDLDYSDIKGKASRKDLKAVEFEETMLLNFYSAVGINFGNIASNDALISSMLNSVTEEGWELFQIISGVESDAGSTDGNGIFITRYIFMKKE